MNEACRLLQPKKRTQRIARSEVPVRMRLCEAQLARDARQFTYVGDVPHVLVDGVLHPVKIVVGQQSA